MIRLTANENDQLMDQAWNTTVVLHGPGYL